MFIVMSSFTTMLSLWNENRSTELYPLTFRNQFLLRLGSTVAGSNSKMGRLYITNYSSTTTIKSHYLFPFQEEIELVRNQNKRKRYLRNVSISYLGGIQGNWVSHGLSNLMTFFSSMDYTPQCWNLMWLSWLKSSLHSRDLSFQSQGRAVVTRFFVDMRGDKLLWLNFRMIQVS